MKRPAKSSSTRSRGVIPRQHPDAPRFDPYEWEWDDTDGGLGNATREASLPAAATRYALAQATTAAAHWLAHDAVMTYRRVVLGMSARDVVERRHGLTDSVADAALGKRSRTDLGLGG